MRPQFVSATHPRFGRVPALKTVRPVSAGEEILTHYKYDMALAPTWYTEAYRRFSAVDGIDDDEEEGEELGKDEDRNFFHDGEGQREI